MGTTNDYDDSDFDATIAAARAEGLTVDQVAQLALRLAHSGIVLSWESGVVADIASTGGPGSLSTLITPLMLRSRGFRVVKLAVPGRPAGGIDVLGCVPQYRVSLSDVEVRQIVSSTGYAHFIANEQFAPFDARLFEYRRRVGAVAVPALAAASLLAKKVAAGVDVVGLDVRCGPHGNFGQTWTEAKASAELFCEAARTLDITAVAFLTTIPAPEQPWIGRGEALRALSRLFNEQTNQSTSADVWLLDHIRRCSEMASELASTAQLSDVFGDQIGAPHLRDLFVQNLESQGSDWVQFEEEVERLNRMQQIPIEAEQDGFFALDVSKLREVIVAAQEQHHLENPSVQFSDPVGVLLHVRPNQQVRTGDVLGVARFATGAREHTLAGLRSALRIGNEPTSEMSQKESANHVVIRA